MQIDVSILLELQGVPTEMGVQDVKSVVDIQGEHEGFQHDQLEAGR